MASILISMFDSQDIFHRVILYYNIRFKSSSITKIILKVKAVIINLYKMLHESDSRHSLSNK